MEKFKRFCEIFIQVFFVLLLGGVFAFNLIQLKLDNTTTFLCLFLLLLSFIVILWLYKKNFINKKILYIYNVILLLIGIGIRIFLIENIDFVLASDFDFVFSNAEAIMNNALNNTDYLSYNGYSYIYSVILVGIFKVFGVGVSQVLYVNLGLQLLTCYFLYKILNFKISKEVSGTLSMLYFLLPTIIFANLLVATETPFMLMMLICIYFFYKIISKRELNIINCLLYYLFGVTICISNYIRPVMLVFLIALAIYYILTMKKVKEIFLLLLVFIAYSISDFAMNAYVENGIGQPTRSGALGWSVYFGSNYDTCGSWSEEDSAFTFEFLQDPNNGDKELIVKSFERLQGYGIIKTTKLMGCKFRNLWTNNNGTFDFVEFVVNHENGLQIMGYASAVSSIGTIIVLILLVLSGINIYNEIKEKREDYLFLELFGVGYILSNLLVCLNGRYNLPLYPVLIICASVYINKIVVPSKKEKIESKKITKIENKHPKVLLIVPAYNEEESIQNTIETIKKEKIDYIIINDGSKDRTEEICKANNYNFISLISNLGIGGAVQTGYKYALKNDYDIAIQFDADGQHDVKYVKDIIKPIVEEKAHFVIGSRFIDKNVSGFKSTKSRRIGINLISGLMKIYSKKKIYDVTSGFRAANRDVIKCFADSYPSEYPEPISSFELIKNGYKIKEIPVKMHERSGGKSSIVSWKKAYYMFNVFLSIIIVQMRGE